MFWGCEICFSVAPLPHQLRDNGPDFGELPDTPEAVRQPSVDG